MNGHRTETPLGLLPDFWRVVSLPEVVFFQEGPGLRNWQWTDSGMKVINVTNILSDGSVDVHNTYRYVSLEEYEAKYSHFAVQAGDVVVASSGNTYGKVGRINRSHLPLMMNTSVVRLHSRSRDTLDDDFLYGFLRSPMFKNQVEQFVVGSAQPNFGPSHLKLMMLPLPPLQTQARIASILSAYDDLIENNTRRIKILEDMAQMLYREWFVNFRFPGHEKVRMVESELGPIPEGWSVRPVSEVYRTGSGGTPSRKVPSYFGGSIPWVKTQELADGFIHDADEKITKEGLKNSSAKLHPAGAVLMAMYGATIGKLGILRLAATCNQACCAMVAKQPNLGAEYLFLALLIRRSDILALRMGAAQQNISQEVIKAFPLLCPNDEVMVPFNNIVAPLMTLIGILQSKNLNLRTTRDLLLPKLISGEIPVEASDDHAAELMEQTA